MPHSGRLPSRLPALRPITHGVTDHDARGGPHDSLRMSSAFVNLQSVVMVSFGGSVRAPTSTGGVGRRVRSRAAVTGGLDIHIRPTPAVGPGQHLGSSLFTLNFSTRARPSINLGSLVHLDRIRHDLRQSARALSTRQMYWAWFLTFESFCSAHGLTVFPASVETCERYVAFLISMYTAGTIGIALAAVAAVHVDAGVFNPTRAPGVRQCTPVTCGWPC